MTGDKKLYSLFARRLEIDVQIRERKKEIAIEGGQVVRSIDDLTCKEHSGAAFRVLGAIPSSHSGNLRGEGKEGRNVYECETCTGSDNKVIKSKAYDCPNCGIVVGEYEIRPYRSSPESWRQLAGREGDHYYCRVCDTFLGAHYWRLS